MKTIEDVKVDYCCPYCKETYYNVVDKFDKFVKSEKLVCNKTTLHLSSIYVHDVEEGINGTQVFGFRKIQKTFIEGYYAAQYKENMKEGNDYLTLAFNAGFKSFGKFYK